MALVKVKPRDLRDLLLFLAALKRLLTNSDDDLAVEIIELAGDYIGDDNPFGKYFFTE